MKPGCWILKLTSGIGNKVYRHTWPILRINQAFPIEYFVHFDSSDQHEGQGGTGTSSTMWILAHAYFSYGLFFGAWAKHLKKANLSVIICLDSVHMKNFSSHRKDFRDILHSKFFTKIRIINWLCLKSDYNNRHFRWNQNKFTILSYQILLV